MTCENCRQALSVGQWSSVEDWKSCPRCSQEDGVQHVFHAFPADYGQTTKRSSALHPDGPQSHCNECCVFHAIAITDSTAS
jgi:uncharacterized Zn finger protein